MQRYRSRKLCAEILIRETLCRDIDQEPFVETLIKETAVLVQTCQVEDRHYKGGRSSLPARIFHLKSTAKMFHLESTGYLLHGSKLSGSYSMAVSCRGDGPVTRLLRHGCR